MALALEFDRKIVIEAPCRNAREIECAVLGNDEPEASVLGEVVPSREFYDYEAKYLDDGSKVIIPAPLPASHRRQRFSALSHRGVPAVDGAGMARVDFLMDRDTGAIFLNEVNTIPGFTTISMYPKMWEASGLSLRRAARPPDRARPRTSRGEAAAAHQHHVTTAAACTIGVVARRLSR